jgi:hypothetical protein
LKLELARERDRQVDKELEQTNTSRAQAERVAIWVEENLPSEERPCLLYYANTSHLPIYNAMIRFEAGLYAPDGALAERNGTGVSIYQTPVYTLPPSAARVELGTPSAVFNMALRQEMLRTHNAFPNDTAARMNIELIFDDASGIRWSRDQHGQLRQVDSDYETPIRSVPLGYIDDDEPWPTTVKQQTEEEEIIELSERFDDHRPLNET